MAGMSVHAMIRYWQYWASRFHPNIVVVYAAPFFYLGEFAPGAARQDPAAVAPPPVSEGPGLRSRLVLRMKDVFHLPDFIQDWRRERRIAAQLAGKDPAWFFRQVPQERLNHFADDLTELIRLIRRDGARVVLLTYATRHANPPRPEDWADLHGGRASLRATEEVIAEFERAAAAREIALGAELGIEVVDVGEVMNGRREYFADPVHFNDDGAAVIASLVAGHLETLRSPTSNAK
jgi:hypothetical protein